ncbi:MAG: toxin-antitoxin system, toxin component, PIN family protein [Symploca sp. SIO2G7]|nr:toxin-antitoxin system, toxin component, PIN family protein [Symploca sp. SIO2G7]
MKLLLDTCIWSGVLTELVAAGYDVVWTGNWSEDPGDEAILETAYRESRILVTLDNDFGELAILRGIPHCGILRLVNLTTRQQIVVCLQVLTLYGNELASGAIITAELARVRIRPPDNE